MPHISSAAGVDASYPMQIPFSNEYFFQTSGNCKSPWEAVAYEDGRLFYERSSALLKYRKMFCWGSHRGGRRWCDFLALPTQGDYIEVQGGFAPTQLHGLDMPAETVWDFTQIIGVLQVDTAISHQKCWHAACDYIHEQVDSCINEDEVYRLHEKFKAYAGNKPVDILNTGSGWGALERLRRKKQDGREVPKGFHFQEASMGAPQLPWLTLLQEGSLPECDVNAAPVSWMVQDEWQQLLEESFEKSPPNWNALMHYGVMLYEKGEEDWAMKVWEKSLETRLSPWVCRNLAEAFKQKGNMEEAIGYFEKAYAISGGFPDKALAEEYLALLIQNGELQKAWEVYEALPPHFAKGDRIRILAAPAALELDKTDFMQEIFNTEFAVLREGEMTNMDLWYGYNARKLAAARGVKVNDELVREAAEKFPLPANLDFRVSGDSHPFSSNQKV